MATDIRAPYLYVFSMAYYTHDNTLLLERSKYTLMNTFFERTSVFI